MLLAVIGVRHLVAFVLFSCGIGLVCWGVSRFIKQDPLRVGIFVVLGIFWLMMVYDLFVGGGRLASW